ncbi:MAG: hypothetical protein MK082_06525 [Phycisphaerales bacterium]|nr:hypothetical protein [Phycisphaerales bacterium]
MTRCATVIAFLVVSASNSGLADTYYVPSEYPTIQQAWDAIPGSGGPGWYIMVEPGTYNENLVLSDKTCWVIGEGDPGDVVIDGNSSGTVVEIANTPFNGGVFLENLVLTGGSGIVSGWFSYGGAMNIWDGGSATIHDCTLHTNAAIYGGGVYVAEGSSFSTYQSVLSGNSGLIGGGALSMGWLNMDDTTMNSNESYYGGHICLAADTETSLISNSSLVGGRSVIASDADSSGGGAIAIIGTGEVTLRNCNLLDNEADERGGAIYVGDPLDQGGERTLTISDSLLRLNDSGKSGGAIYFDNIGTMQVTDSDFEVNESSYGGSGCWLELGEFTFDDCTFSDQSMIDVGTGFRNGGAIFALDCPSLELSNSTFTGNDAVFHGGALYLNSSPTNLVNCVFDANDAGSWADAIDAVRYTGAQHPNTLNMVGCQIRNHPDSTAVRSSSGVINAVNCTFTFNRQGFLNSGAVWIYNDDSNDPCSFIGCTFSDNSSGDRGGALCLDDCTVEIDDCEFIRNIVSGPNDYRGGAVFTEGGASVTISNSTFSENECDGDGGAIGASDGSSVVITDSTFNDNSATEDGGAVHLDSGSLDCQITGSRLENNEALENGGAIFNGRYGNSIEDCEVVSNTCGLLGGGIRATQYTTLQDSTICGNSPSQTSGNIGDLGGNIIASSCSTCPADLDGDGAVSGSDLSLILGSWGACTGCQEDLNGDGAVDGADLAIVLASWGPCS